jgi:hypothetical protein
MRGVQAFALFCDSVRDETTSTQTIVGVFPDNLNIAKVPSMIPRLSIYIRVMVDPTEDPGPMILSLVFPDGTEKAVQTFDAETVTAARAKSRETEMPYTGMITNITFPTFPVMQFGRVKVLLRAGEEEIVCGALTFLEAPASTALGRLETISLTVPKGLTQPDEPSLP